MSTQYIQQNTYTYSVKNINKLQINMWLACGQDILFSRLMNQIYSHNINKTSIKCIVYSESETNMFSLCLKFLKNSSYQQSTYV